MGSQRQSKGPTCAADKNQEKHSEFQEN